MPVSWEHTSHSNELSSVQDGDLMVIGNSNMQTEVVGCTLTSIVQVIVISFITSSRFHQESFGPDLKKCKSNDNLLFLFYQCTSISLHGGIVHHVVFYVPDPIGQIHLLTKKNIPPYIFIYFGEHNFGFSFFHVNFLGRIFPMSFCFFNLFI